MKEFKPRDKLTQRMTRDGAVLDNQTTGEEIHISERDEENVPLHTYPLGC